MWRPLQLLKKWENSKRGIITGSLGCQNSPICHVKVCYDYISQASPPIDYPTKNCSRQQQGDKFFSLFVYITCYFVIDHLNVIGWLNVDHSVFQKEELWLALIYVCSNCIPFYIIYVSLSSTRVFYFLCSFTYYLAIWFRLWSGLKPNIIGSLNIQMIITISIVRVWIWNFKIVFWGML